MQNRQYEILIACLLQVHYLVPKNTFKVEY